MSEPSKPVLSISRGVIGAVGGAAGAAALVGLFAVGNRAYEWANFRASPFRPNFDVLAVSDDWLVPVIGCAIIAGCAGWAAFAPARRSRFAVTLALVFLGSVPLWAVLGSQQLTVQRGFR